MKKVALITGTSSGFGMLTAVELAKSGFQTIATMRDLKKRAVLAETSRQERVAERMEILQLDITNQARVRQVVDEIVQRHGRIDLLVNNAGFALGGLVEEIPMDEWRRQFETNVFGLIQTTQAVLPVMRRQKNGTIINISSISGQIGFPMMAPYAASKHAVEGFSEALRLEVAPLGIRVVLVEPGAYQTAIWEKGLAAVSAHASGMPDYDRIKELVMPQAERIARTGGNPREVAQLIARISKTPEPGLRYPIGKGVKRAIWLKKVLPWAWIERMMQTRLR